MLVSKSVKYSEVGEKFVIGRVFWKFSERQKNATYMVITKMQSHLLTLT